MTAADAPAPVLSLSPSDPRFVFARAVTTAREVVDGVRPDQLDLPTVCPEHDVRSMLGHMLVVLRRIAALGNGTDPMAMPDVVTGVADDGWPAAFEAEAHDVQSAWADAGTLDTMMVLPWATAPGSAMLAMYTSELTVHTHDLALATGQQVEWYAPALEVSLASALQVLPPPDRTSYFAEMAKQPGFRPDLAQRPPFADVVPVPDDAPTLDRLLGWYGRQPASLA